MPSSVDTGWQDAGGRTASKKLGPFLRRGRGGRGGGGLEMVGSGLEEEEEMLGGGKEVYVRLAVVARNWLC